MVHRLLMPGLALGEQAAADVTWPPRSTRRAGTDPEEVAGRDDADHRRLAVLVALEHPVGEWDPATQLHM